MIYRYYILILTLLTFVSVKVDSQVQQLNHFTLKPGTSGYTPLPSNSISNMVICENIIWIGTGKGLGRSEDAGRTWKNYAGDPAFASKGIFAIAVRDSVIWTSTGFTKQVHEGSVQTGSGFTYSLNRGIRWHHVPQALDSRGDSIIQYGINDSIWTLPIIVPEQNVTFDISLTERTVWIASWAGGLRKSTNNGETWERILLPLDNMNSLKPTDTLWWYASTDTLKTKRIYPRFDPRNNNNLLAFSVHAVDEDTIWCGTAGGVNKSTDGGKSWFKFNRHNQKEPILGNWVIAIAEQSYQGKSRIWCTNWKTGAPLEDYGVSYTDDGGRTWKNHLHGVKAYDFAFKDSIAYIASALGLYRTTDGGLSFSRYTTITDSATRNTIGSTVFYSVAVLGDTIFVGTTDGMASSIDNAENVFGANWKVYRKYQQVGAKSISYAYPNPFSPSLDILRIHYGSKNTSPDITTFFDRKVSIDIFDFGMNRIKTLIKNAPRHSDAEYDEIWDGRDDSGNIVPNGVYFYRIVIDNEEHSLGKILVIQ